MLLMKAFLPIMLECPTLSKLSGLNIQAEMFYANANANMAQMFLKKNVWLAEQLMVNYLASFFYF